MGSDCVYCELAVIGLNGEGEEGAAVEGNVDGFLEVDRDPMR